MLRDQGVFISISFGQPHFRRLLLLQLEYGWNLSWAPVGDSFHYYVYLMQKGGPGRPLTVADLPAAPSQVVVTPKTDDALVLSSSEEDVDTFFGKLADYSDGE